MGTDAAVAVTDIVTALEPGIIPPDHAERGIAWINSMHALVYDGSKTLIWSRVEDPSTRRKSWRQSSVSDFRTYYSAFLVPDGTRYKSLAEFWLQHQFRRSYRNVVFDPAMTKREAADANALNLWNGFSVSPHEGDWSRLREHIFEIVAGGRQDLFDYIIGWMARLVQFPGEPAGTAVVMRGSPGAGKGLLARALGRVFGDHFLHISHTGQLTNRFNGALADAVLVLSDEAVWAGDRPGEGALKALITEPTLAIERKGREIVTVKNHVHLMMASNNEWVAPVGLRDRRFCVMDVLDSRIGDRSYFSLLSHEQSNGGAGAMLYDLLHHDLTQFVPSIIPKTSARAEQALKSMDPMDKWLHECLSLKRIGNEDWGRIDRSELYAALLRTLNQWKTQYIPSHADLGRRLRRVFPSLESGRSTMARFYVLPNIDAARIEFSAYIGENIDWSQLSSDED